MFSWQKLTLFDHKILYLNSWWLQALKEKSMICNFTWAMLTVLPSESWDSGRELHLMVPSGKQWLQTDRSDRWHTLVCGKSLLCWQRARFFPSCSKCELIQSAFHSEGETRNRPPEELRGLCPKEESCVCVCVCLGLCVAGNSMCMHVYISSEYAEQSVQQ